MPSHTTDNTPHPKNLYHIHTKATILMQTVFRVSKQIVYLILKPFPGSVTAIMTSFRFPLDPAAVTRHITNRIRPSCCIHEVRPLPYVNVWTSVLTTTYNILPIRGDPALYASASETEPLLAFSSGISLSGRNVLESCSFQTGTYLRSVLSNRRSCKGCSCDDVHALLGGACHRGRGFSTGLGSWCSRKRMEWMT